MAYVFQKVSREGRMQGLEPGSIEARDWFRDRAQTATARPGRLMNKKANLQTNVLTSDVGRMFMFFYDPKWKVELPFYDRFPMIFVMENYSDGFLGMNLHYLPPMYRARLMDALYSIETTDSQHESKKLKASYGLLKSAGKYKYFKPCIKRYLFNHVKSRFLYIPYDEWDIALLLPVERFKKARKQRVWEDSKQKIRNG